MTSSGNGLPPRGPGGQRLGARPQLPAQPGGREPFQADGATPHDFPDPEAERTIEEASRDRAAARGVATAPVGAPPAPAPEAAPLLPVLGIPRSFDELLFNATLVTPSREVSVVVEQTIAAGASGSTTVSLPANTVDIARTFREGGDGSVSYRIEVDGAGRTAIGDHRVTGGERSFSRYFEKYNQIIVTFTNNDPVNAALLQIEWVSVQLEPVKWQAYRDNVRAWLIEVLGVRQ